MWEEKEMTLGGTTTVNWIYRIIINDEKYSSTKLVFQSVWFDDDSECSEPFGRRALLHNHGKQFFVQGAPDGTLNHTTEIQTCEACLGSTLVSDLPARMMYTTFASSTSWFGRAALWNPHRSPTSLGKVPVKIGEHVMASILAVNNGYNWTNKTL